MATKRRKTNQNSRSQSAKSVAARRQLMSVIWFAIAIFFLCVVFIEGQNVWTFIHNLIFGVFGITAYFFPFLLGFIAVMFALDKMTGSITAKSIESGIFVILIGAAVDIFSKHDPSLNFWEHLVHAYKRWLFRSFNRSSCLFGIWNTRSGYYNYSFNICIFYDNYRYNLNYLF